MKSLAERHADRAKRKAENELQSEAPTLDTYLDKAAALLSEGQSIAMRLSPEDQEQLRGRLAELSEANADFANDPLSNIQDDRAGIGVLNPVIVPMQPDATAAAAGNGGGVQGAAGWGMPAPGQGGASDAQQGGSRPAWPEQRQARLEADYGKRTVPQLQEVLTAREVAYESDANKARLVELAVESHKDKGSE